MKRISSKVKTSSKEFIENKKDVQRLLSILKNHQQAARKPESDKAKDKLTLSKKLTLSERLECLIDHDS